MSSRKYADLVFNNGHSGSKPDQRLHPQTVTGKDVSDVRWNELFDDLERLLLGVRRAFSLTADESDDIRSDVVLRLLTILINEQVQIRVSLEAWLRDLIRMEIREYFNQQSRQPKLVLVDNRHLTEIAAFIHETTDDRQPSSSARQAELRKMLQAIESVRLKVGESQWALFIDVTVHKTPIKIAANRHGKSYSAAHKAYKRIQQLLQKQVDRNGT